MYATEAMARDVLDTSSHLRQWNYRGTRCDRCGTPNSAVAGLLLQCGKCKSAYYCTSACFNADLQRHTAFCQTARLDRQPKAGPDLYRDRCSGIETDGTGEGTGGTPKAHRTQLSLPDPVASPRHLAPATLYRRPTRPTRYSSDDSDDSSSSSSSSSSESTVTCNTTAPSHGINGCGRDEQGDEGEEKDEQEEEVVVVVLEEEEAETDEESRGRDGISTVIELKEVPNMVAPPRPAAATESAMKEGAEGRCCDGTSNAVKQEDNLTMVALPSPTVAAESADKEALVGRDVISTSVKMDDPKMVSPPSLADAFVATAAAVKEDAECRYQDGISTVVEQEDDSTTVTPPSPALATEAATVPEGEPTPGPKPEPSQDVRVPSADIWYADADEDDHDEDAGGGAADDDEDDEEDEYRRRGRIPVEAETMQAQRRLRVGDGIIPEHHWDPETVTLEEAETIRRQYGWDVPEWVLRSPLRRSKLGGRLAQDGADLSREKRDASRAQQPEWAVRSPLRRRSQQPGTVSPTQAIVSNELQQGTPKKRVDDLDLATRRLDPNLISDDHPSTPTATTVGRATFPKNRAPKLPEWALNSPPKISSTKVRGTTTSDAARSPARCSSASAAVAFPNTKTPSQPTVSSPNQTRETTMSPRQPMDGEVGSPCSGQLRSLEPIPSTASATFADLSPKKSFPLFPRSPVRAELRNAPFPATSQLPEWVVKSPLRRRTAPPAKASTRERSKPSGECTVAHTQLRSTAKKRPEGDSRSEDPLIDSAADPPTNSP